MQLARLGLFSCCCCSSYAWEGWKGKSAWLFLSGTAAKFCPCKISGSNPFGTRDISFEEGASGSSLDKAGEGLWRGPWPRVEGQLLGHGGRCFLQPISAGHLLSPAPGRESPKTTVASWRPPARFVCVVFERRQTTFRKRRIVTLVFRKRTLRRTPSLASPAQTCLLLWHCPRVPPCGVIRGMLRPAACSSQSRHWRGSFLAWSGVSHEHCPSTLTGAQEPASRGAP